MDLPKIENHQTLPMYAKEVPQEEVESQKIVEKYVFACDRCRKRKFHKCSKRKSYSTRKTGCPCQYHFTLTEKGDWFVCQTEEHARHGTNDPLYEPLNERILQLCTEQLNMGISACKIIDNLRNRDVELGLTEAELSSLTKEKIQRLQQKLKKSKRFHENDRLSVIEMQKLPDFHIIFHRDGRSDFRVGICSDFQASMLRKFGDFVFLDSVHGVTSMGLFQLTILVADESGKGVPVGFCLASCEDGEAWKYFLQEVFKKAERDPSQSIFMSDCCVKIRSAVSHIGAKKHYICWFHMMQNIDRKLKTLCRGPTKKTVMKRIKYRIRDLQQMKDKKIYEKRRKEFYEWLEQDREVKKCMSSIHSYRNCGMRITANTLFRYYFDETWHIGDRCDMWVAYGRLNEEKQSIGWHGHVTNNLLENYFQQQKYRFSNTRRTVRVDQHIQLLVKKVIPSYIADRQQMLQGIIRSRKQRKVRNLDDGVMWLKSPGNIVPIVNDIGLGMAKEQLGEENHFFCLSDLSCTCQERTGDICEHLEAAASMWDITENMITHSAKAIRQESMMQSRTSSSDAFKCVPLAAKYSMRDINGKKYFLTEAKEGCEYCDCPVFSRASVCPHLLALRKCEDLISGSEHPLIGADDVKAFRLCMGLNNTDDDPSTLFQNECAKISCPTDEKPFYHVTLDKMKSFLKKLTTEELTVAADRIDGLLKDLEIEIHPSICSGWAVDQPEFDKSNNRKSTDKIEKPLNPNRISSSKRQRKTSDEEYLST